eukprot:jgi/Mesvir1/19315/Mv10381-RA.1
MPEKEPAFDHSRRLFCGAVVAVSFTDWSTLSKPASASGLIQFPPTSLYNTYYLVRAGESAPEAAGIVFTNPVDNTSMDSGLTPTGREQVLRTLVPSLLAKGACERSCWLWPSINQRAYQTAEIVARQLDIGRNRIVPEYSFLDPRGLGAFQGKDAATAWREVYAQDALSIRNRPPRYTDGTPNESVEDVFVRVRQLLSVLETQFSGDDVVIISPDSDNLSILEAALRGYDLGRHSDLYYKPGEVRRVSFTEEDGVVVG